MPSFVVGSAPGLLVLFPWLVVPSSACTVLPGTSVDKLDVHVFPGEGSNVIVTRGDGSNVEVQSLNGPIDCDPEDEGVGTLVVAGACPEEGEMLPGNAVEDDFPPEDTVVSVTAVEAPVVTEPVTVTLVVNSTLAEDSVVADSATDDVFPKVTAVDKPASLESVTDTLVVSSVLDDGPVLADCARDCAELLVTKVDTLVVPVPVTVSALVC